jgi:hypothetical protein
VIHAWPPAAKQRLLQLRAQKPAPPFSRTAEILNQEFDMSLTRNAIAGMARRLVLPPKPPPPPPIKPIEPEIAPPAPGADGLDIYQLRADTCRWPAGDAPPYRYCGETTIDGAPYCDTHCERAYTTPRTRWE